MTAPVMTGMLKLSLNREKSSVVAPPNAPGRAMVAGRRSMQMPKLASRHARVPSNVFFRYILCFPMALPTMAATLSPMTSTAIDATAMSFEYRRMQTSDPAAN